MASSTAPQAPRVVLRDVAEAANVSLMTASLAIRNSPKLSAKTGSRVRAIAKKIGYRPDPELSRLMLRLRLSRKTRFSDVIATIDLRPSPQSALHIYDIGVREGIARKADQLGFGVTNFHLFEYGNNITKLLRVIRHRGIAGVILLPANRPSVVLSDHTDWQGLSVVSSTTCVSSPRFHQVAPNIIHNITRVLEITQSRGYQRISAILGEALETRTAHHYSLALTWYGHRDRILVVPNSHSVDQQKRSIREWLKKTKAEVVLAQDGTLVAEQLDVLHPRSRPLIISLSNRPDHSMPFLDQLPDLIGESAMSQLSGMMHNNETDIPEHPRVTTIDGVFREAT